MNYATVLASLRDTLAKDKANYADAVDRLTRTQQALVKAEQDEKDTAAKVKETEDTIRVIEELMESLNQKAGVETGVEN